VTVAQALASDPVLIVASTSTRGVDVASKELLLSELDRITTETGASLLLASDVRQAMTWVDVVRITMQFLC
jgi:simple sugar transport system ATP-binding protein